MRERIASFLTARPEASHFELATTFGLSLAMAERFMADYADERGLELEAEKSGCSSGGCSSGGCSSGGCSSGGCSTAGPAAAINALAEAARSKKATA